MHKEIVVDILLKKVHVPRETIYKLEEYTEKLMRWNKQINLIGKGTINNIWYQHILDCAQIVKYIGNFQLSLTDFGSGAGLPGVILSILGVNEVHLIEKNAKKVAFLNGVKSISEEKIYIHNENIHSLAGWKSEIITSRALASLKELFDFTYKFTDNNSKILFPKGKTVDTEINDAQKTWSFEYQKHESMTSSEGCILEIKNLKRR